MRQLNGGNAPVFSCSFTLCKFSLKFLTLTLIFKFLSLFFSLGSCFSFIILSSNFIKVLEVFILSENFFSINIRFSSTVKLSVLIHFSLRKITNFFTLIRILFNFCFKSFNFVSILIFLSYMAKLCKFGDFIIKAVFLCKVIINYSKIKFTKFVNRTEVFIICLNSRYL